MNFNLGSNSYIGENTEVFYWHHLPEDESIVQIGKYTSIGSNVKFFIDGNHHYEYASLYPFKEICGVPTVSCGWGKGASSIGNDVWIANNVLVMSGVKIGDGSVISAGSIVTHDVLPYSIVGGNPARLIKYRFEKEIIEQFLEIKWWDLPHEFIIEKLAPIQNDPCEWIDRVKKHNKKT